MPTELKWQEAIDSVLSSSPEPLHYSEITDRIIADGLRKNIGKTPADTVRVIINWSLKNEGENSPYIRVDKGVFALRAKQPTATSQAKLKKDRETALTNSDAESQYDIVSSFGMFWRKDLIEWTANPKLWGMQRIGATPVDFCKQLGIYLLYDGRECIYVGRSTDRPLGKRLYEHTFDRMAARWDRFSWFGLLPVLETGDFGALPKAFDPAKVVAAFEAMLIEAMEPRQNRKRGDDLAAAEYIQHEDPAIKKKRLKELLDSAVSKL